MLLPSDKPLFENVSSNEYFTRAGQLRDGKVDGIVLFTFQDYEEAIVFSEGKPVTGIHEAKRWLTVGDELVEVVENKAMAAHGRMSAYRLDTAILQIFLHMNVKNMVETKLGKYLTPALLTGFLEGDRSTCILKLYDDNATAYVYINNGKRAGAAFVSQVGRSYGENAVRDMARFKENTSAAIYFMELAARPKIEIPAVEPVKPKAPAIVETPRPAEVPVVEPARLPATAAPTIKAPAQIEASIKAIQPRLAKSLPVPPVPKPSGIRLSVAMSEDDILGLRHRSRQQVLEALEEEDVAWVDARTLASMPATGQKVNIVLPDGREYRVTLKEAAIEPVENRFIILPRKLRSRLSLSRGMTVEVKE